YASEVGFHKHHDSNSMFVTQDQSADRLSSALRVFPNLPHLRQGDDWVLVLRLILVVERDHAGAHVAVLETAAGVDGRSHVQLLDGLRLGVRGPFTERTLRPVDAEAFGQTGGCLVLPLGQLLLFENRMPIARIEGTPL